MPETSAAFFISIVSTHSRPKAAGSADLYIPKDFLGFNTQPPEGGWIRYHHEISNFIRFQHTAARRRLGHPFLFLTVFQCFNTQPPEGGWMKFGDSHNFDKLFQHTAARRRLDGNAVGFTAASMVSTHSRPKAAGRFQLCVLKLDKFQHTAARRRLGVLVII